MKTTLFCFFLLPFLPCEAAGPPQTTRQDLNLWYNRPATDWMSQALPIGNGFIGAMFFGQTDTEHIQFSETSLWSGGPGAGTAYDYGNREDAYRFLPVVRQLIEEHRMREADSVAKQELTGIRHLEADGKSYDFGAQQTMGDLYVETSITGPVEDYRRQLDIGNAVGSVQFSANGNHYSRSFFGNYPDRVMVYRFASTAKTDYTLWFAFPHPRVSESYDSGIYRFRGKVADNGLPFEMACRIHTDGKVSFAGGKLSITSASFITLVQTAATGYRLKYPLYRGNDFIGQNRRALAAVSRYDYDALKQRHIRDYRALFDRVILQLPDEEQKNTLPTDQRLTAYAAGEKDPALESLLFQYGRYLMISASRPGGLPMNLQATWNDQTDPPWENDYHMNINEEMLYWPAEKTNLSECHLPLMTYIASLVEPGSHTAKTFFNARGWVVNTMNNAWGFTAPGWGLPWGYFPGGAAWLCRHLWTHYLYTGDKAFLRDTAYSIMKRSAEFWLDYLVRDKQGFWVSSPSYSPEHGTISGGAAMDQELAWDIFDNCIAATKALSIDEPFRRRLKQKQDSLLPLQIGRWGQLQEWKEDLDDSLDHHRHVSQLFALYPGDEVSLEKTPALAHAAEVALAARGDEGTGWSLAWKISFWARLHNGARAYQVLHRLIRPANGRDARGRVYGSGLYENLLDACPPFQLDGNMGATAGIAEMLVQRIDNHLLLLPALPPSWTNGEVKGLCTEGGFVVDMRWKDGKVTAGAIHSKLGGDCRVSFNGQTILLHTVAGKTYDLIKYIR